MNVVGPFVIHSFRTLYRLVTLRHGRGERGKAGNTGTAGSTDKLSRVTYEEPEPPLAVRKWVCTIYAKEPTGLGGEDDVLYIEEAGGAGTLIRSDTSMPRTWVQPPIENPGKFRFPVYNRCALDHHVPRGSQRTFEGPPARSIPLPVTRAKKKKTLGSFPVVRRDI